MPFQEITRAVFSAPTRPMPQLIEPVPTSPWDTPNATRPASSRPRLRLGRPCREVEASVSRPLSAQPPRPSSTACLAPRRSATAPEKGRESRVAAYWVLITTPASTEP